ncbi:hypothetical protein CPB83DRAFT_134639 [Crepidotus variabilis]|uniref:Uncharacterized protein n=1 Tax=Crepidotus variabilis TaxID=179855 RepID=A0A9P6E475_9AGAR|nr:hypothetical protein CPB83DRAFT_134639 [Crepidotus variabilis]
MDPASYPPVPPDVARIAGPLIIGYLFNWGLFGVLCMQVFLYYLCVSKDPLPIQAIVYSLCIFQAAQTFLLTQSAFNTFASGFGNVNLIHDMHHLWFSIPIMTSAITLFVQIFFAYRIFTISRRKLIPAVIALLAAVQLGGGFATGIFAKRTESFTRFMGRTENITAGIWHGAGALGDIFICSSMLYYVRFYPSPQNSLHNS